MFLVFSFFFLFFSFFFLLASFLQGRKRTINLSASFQIIRILYFFHENFFNKIVEIDKNLEIWKMRFIKIQRSLKKIDNRVSFL